MKEQLKADLIIDEKLRQTFKEFPAEDTEELTLQFLDWVQQWLHGTVVTTI
jgi:hypothetical protein